MRTPFRKHRHRLRRGFAGIAGITAAAILGTLLVPTAASADEPAAPAVLHETLELGGTGDLDYRRPIEFSNNNSCTHLQAPWIVLTDDKTGEEYLGDEWYYSEQIRFQDTGMRYPGNSFTLTFYDKIAAGATCSSDDPDDFLPQASPYKVVKVDVDWEKPEITKSFTAKYGNSEYLFLTLSPRWDGFKSSSSLGAPAVYEISDYKRPTQRIRAYSTSCYHPGDLAAENDCMLQSYYDFGDLIGIAAIPDNAPHDDVDVWPPSNAISSTLIVYGGDGTSEPAELTKAGPNESKECYQMCAGDPVDTSNGTLYDRQIDMTIPGRIGIDLQRTYSTGQLDTIGAFGPGTALGYDMRIDQISSSKITVVEPSGNRTAFSGYGTFKPVTKSVRASLEKTSTGWKFKRWDEELSYVFNSTGQLTAIRDANGNTVTITHDAGHISRIAEGDRYVDLGWTGTLLTSVTDHTGRVVTYQYDADGRVRMITDPAGRTQQYAYDAAGRVTQMTAPDGGVTSTSYDTEGRASQQTMPDGQVLDFSYGTPDENEVVTHTVTIGDVVRSYTYAYGRIAEYSDSSDPLAAFSQSYDAEGRLILKNYIDGHPRQEIRSYTDAGDLAYVGDLGTGGGTAMEYDADHLLIASTDAAGVRTELTRDAAGNITTSTVIPTDSAPSQVTSFTVDTDGDQLAVTDPEGGLTSMTYTDAGEVASTEDPEGGITRNTYDALGRLVTTVSPGGNVEGSTAENTALFTTEYAYDVLSNAISVTDSRGTTAYTYDAMNRPLTVTDARGKTQTSEYDAAGRIVKDIAPDGSFDQFSYDVDTGLRTSWTDPNGLVTSYTHNGATSTVTSPSGDVQTTTVEVQGNAVVTTQNGDVAMRESSTTTTSYPADGVSLIERYDSVGRITEAVTPEGAIDYAYDGFGRLIAQEGTDRDVSYSYDSNNQITAVKYPDGTSVSRDYDSAGRITTVTDWAGGEHAFSYDAESRITALESDTGLGYTQTFVGMLTKAKTWTDGSAEIAAFEQDFEATGSLLTERDGEAYSFDDNGSLTSAGSDSITWDGRLITQLGSTTLNYDAQNGRLESISDGSTSLSYTYDDRGNRTSVSDGTKTAQYAWDRLGRLTSLGTTSYGYGTDGIRTSVDGVAQVYSQDLKLLSDGGAKYMWAPDGSLLAQAPLGSTSGVQEALTDLQGSVRQVLDGNLAKLAEYSYTVFGERSLESGTDVTAMGFTSEQHDESGLIYLRYRYYDPQVAQFVSVDPMADTTLDPYGYANGNPLQVVDPLGLFGWADDPWGTFLKNSSTISTVLGVASMLMLLTPAAPLAPFVGGLSTLIAGAATAHAISEGDAVGAVTNGIGMIPGATSVVAGARSAGLLKSAIRGAEKSASRSSVKASSRGSTEVRRLADEVGYTSTLISAAGTEIC